MPDSEPSPDASRFVKTELRSLEGEELKPTEQLQKERFDEVVTRVREIVGPMPTEDTVREDWMKDNNRPWERVCLRGASGRIYIVNKFTGGEYIPDTILLDTQDLNTTENWQLTVPNEKSIDTSPGKMKYTKKPKLPENSHLKIKGKYNSERRITSSFNSQPPQEEAAFKALDDILEDLKDATQVEYSDYDKEFTRSIYEEYRQAQSRPLSAEEYPEIADPQGDFKELQGKVGSFLGRLKEAFGSVPHWRYFTTGKGERYSIFFDPYPNMRVTVSREGGMDQVDEAWSLTDNMGAGARNRKLTYGREVGVNTRHLELNCAYSPDSDQNDPKQVRIIFKKFADLMPKLSGQLNVHGYFQTDPDTIVPASLEAYLKPKVLIGGPPPVPAGAR